MNKRPFTSLSLSMCAVFLCLLHALTVEFVLCVASRGLVYHATVIVSIKLALKLCLPSR